MVRRANLGAGPVGLAMLAVVAASPSLAEDAARSIDLPPQGLGSALEALAAQTHTQVIYSADLVRNKAAGGLKGEFTAEEALRRLLRGSGLELRRTGEGSFAVAREPMAPAGEVDTVTVVATRTPYRAFDVPASVSTVTRERIQETQSPSMGAILQTLPGVTMEGTRLGAEMPTIRGYQGPDIILRVDDARRSLDATVGIYSPLFVDPNFVRQVDVVRGPSSANYGGGGLGGVLSVRTVDAEDILAPGRSVGGQAKVGRRTADGALSTNLMSAVRHDGFSALAGGTFKKYDAVRTGAGNENVQHGMQRNGLFKLGWSPDDDNRLTLSYMRFSDDGWGPTNPSSIAGASNGYQYQEKHQEDVVAAYQFRDGPWVDGKVSLYQTTLSYDNQRRQRSDAGCTGAFCTASDATFKVVTTGGNAQNSSRFEALALGHRLTYGVDGYQDNLGNTSAGGVANVNPNGTMLAIGGFLQDEVELGGGWSVIPTLRYDSYDAKAGGYQANSNSHLSPKISVKWQVLPELGLFASYGDAFRAPTLSELYMKSTGGFRNFSPNPTLKPENARVKEIGATLALDDLLLRNDGLWLKVNYFDEVVKNRIVQMNSGTAANPYQYQNVHQAQRRGAEAELTYRAGPWTARLGASTLQVNDMDSGVNLTSPPDKLTAGLAYAFDENLSARYDGRFVGSQDYDTTTTARRRAYAVHDIGVAYDRDWFRVDLGVGNLFDEAYVPYYSSNVQSYSYAEGRSVNMTLTTRF